MPLEFQDRLEMVRLLVTVLMTPALKESVNCRLRTHFSRLTFLIAWSPNAVSPARGGGRGTAAAPIFEYSRGA